MEKDSNGTIKTPAGDITAEQISPDEVVITLVAAKDRAENVRLKVLNADTQDYVDLIWQSNNTPDK